MAPIYIPQQPVPIIRQKIRNAADIQEQLRAYDRAQQDLVGANAAAFEKTHIHKGVLYPMKLSREESEPAFFDAPEPLAAEEPLGAKRPRVAQEVGRETAQRMFGAEAVMPDPAPVAQARFASPVPAKVMGAVGRPKGAKQKTKTKPVLIKELRAAGTGSLPIGFEAFSPQKLQELAKERGIDINP
jgi:hypothetical protein